MRNKDINENRDNYEDISNNNTASTVRSLSSYKHTLLIISFTDSSADSKSVTFQILFIHESKCS